MLRALGERLDEFVFDTVLDVDPAVCHACLARVPVYAVFCFAGGALDVGVGEDEGGGFAAEFEDGVFEVGFCGGDLDGATGVCGAREGDGADAHVFCEGLTADVSVAAEDVDDAGWEAAFGDPLAEFPGCEGRFFAGFDDHAVPCCEGGSDFFGEEDQGGVPRDDDCYDAEGLAEAEIKEAWGVERSMTLRVGCFCKVVELSGCVIGVDVVCAYWFSHSNCVEVGEFIFLGNDQFTQLLQRRTTLQGGERTPCWKCCLCSVYGSVYIVNGCFCDCNITLIRNTCLNVRGVEYLSQLALLYVGRRGQTFHYH